MGSQPLRSAFVLGPDHIPCRRRLVFFFSFFVIQREINPRYCFQPADKDHGHHRR